MIARLVALVCLIASIAYADVNTQRFLANPSFNSGNQTPEGWKLAGRDAKAFTLARDTDTSRSRPASLRLGSETAGEAEALSDTLRSSPKGRFTFAGFAKSQGQIDKITVVLQTLDSKWGGVDWFAIDVPPSADWTNFTGQFTAGEKATTGVVHLIVRGQGSVWFDDLTLVTEDGVKFDPAADAKKIAAAPVKLAGVKLAPVRQVFVGGGGTVTYIVQHPTAHDVMYAAMDVGGPMRYDFATQTWQGLVDHFGPDNTAGYHCELIALDPNNADKVYFSAGKQWQTGPHGIYRSNDRGKTWAFTQLKTPDGKPVEISNGRTGHRLIVDPKDGKTVYYGSRKNGLFVSTDAGETFTQSTALPIDVNISFIQIGKAAMYVGVNKAKEASSVLRSTDGGKTFAKVDGAPKVIWQGALAGEDLITTGGGIWRYDGQKWFDLTPKDKGRETFHAMGISPHDPNTMVVTESHCGWGNSMHRTFDGGRTWQRFNDDDYNRGKKTIVGQAQPWEGNGGALDRPHAWACSSSFQFDYGDPKRVWGTYWPGVFVIRDITATPLPMDVSVKGHEEICLFDLAAPPSGAPLFSASMDVGGLRHHDIAQMPLQQMNVIKNPHNPGAEDVSDLDFAENDPAVLVAAAGWKYNNTGGAGISRDNGKTWTMFSQPFKSARNGRIAISPDGKTVVWLSRGNVPPFVSGDDGKTWTASRGAPFDMIYDGFVYTFYMPLAGDRADSGKFYLYDRRDGRFYRSDDAGASFAHVSRLPQQTGVHFDRHRIEPTPGKAGDVWAALDREGLFHSTDAGNTWSKLQGVGRAWTMGHGLSPEGKPAVYILGRLANDELKPEQVAVYRSSDAGASWTRLSDPQTDGFGQATVIQGDRQTPGRVYVGTNGRGIYYLDAKD